MNLATEGTEGTEKRMDFGIQMGGAAAKHSTFWI